MAVIGSILRDERLAFWDRLVRGERIEQAELDALLSKLAHEASDEERAGTVLLCAVARCREEMRPASRWRLQAALWYWFSQTGTPDRPARFALRRLRGAGLADLAGLHLTWPEVMQAQGKNPNDYSPLKRIEKDLMRLVQEQWVALFGTEPPPGVRASS